MGHHPGVDGLPDIDPSPSGRADAAALAALALIPRSVVRDDAGRRALKWQLAQFGGMTGLLMLISAAWVAWVVVNSRI